MDSVCTLHWYAARVIVGRMYVFDFLKKIDVETYVAPMVSSIVFVKCTWRQVKSLFNELYGKMLFYRCPDKNEPQAIDEKEMKMFILVTSANGDVISVDVENPAFFKGQRVRVLAGPFEGAEGVIKRIKGDRRLLVSVTGVVAVATSFIHPALLQPIND